MTKNQQQQPEDPRVAYADAAGTFTDQKEAQERMRNLAGEAHFIGGLSAAPPIPDGFALMVQLVFVNMAKTYPVRGGRSDDDEGRSSPPRGEDEVRGIGKDTLMEIAAAMGVKWQPFQRIDDGSDDRVAEVEVRGSYVDIDGTSREIIGHRDVDLRDNSDQIAGKSEREIRQLRMNILRAAETKAKLRAIREAFGIPHGMSVAELRKPFVVPRLVYTGDHRDGRVRQAAGLMIAQRAIGARAAMFGPPPEVPQLPAPMPVGIKEYVTHDGEVISAEGHEVQEERQPQRRAPPPPRPAGPPPAPKPPPPTARAVWPWEQKNNGPPKGHPIAQLLDNDLQYLTDYYVRSIEDPKKAEYRDRNEAELAACRKELERRAPKPQPQPAAQEEKPEAAATEGGK